MRKLKQPRKIRVTKTNDLYCVPDEKGELSEIKPLYRILTMKTRTTIVKVDEITLINVCTAIREIGN